MSDVVEVIVTGPPEFMPGLVETLVSERLIACGQLTPIDSTYRCQGSVEHATEIRAAMHTTRTQAEEVTKRVRALHPYQVPCILLASLVGGESDYCAWIESQTGPAAPAQAH